MPLVLNILEKGFRAIIENPPKSPIDAANKMAKTYADYAKRALAPGVGSAILTGVEARKMASVMAGGFSANGVPPAASASIVQSVFTFWLAPPVSFGAGAAVSWTGGPALGSCLISSLVNPRVPVGVAARLLANCFDTATRLVLVQPVAPGPPVPIG